MRIMFALLALSLLLLPASGSASERNTAPVNTPPKSFFPPANKEECNENSALTWDGKGDVLCSTVIKELPQVNPVFGRSVAIYGVDKINSTMKQVIDKSFDASYTATLKKGEAISEADKELHQNWLQLCASFTEADFLPPHSAITKLRTQDCINWACAAVIPGDDFVYVNGVATGWCTIDKPWSGCPAEPNSTKATPTIQYGCMYTKGGFIELR